MTVIENSKAVKNLPEPIIQGQPMTALAPMQDVTGLEFMKVISEYGSPDYFFTEYFRVHVSSNLEKHILNSITQNQTGRPIFAQLIGESLPDLERTVNELIKYPIAGIDLNMGCPAPKVYKKNVGGGLLRDVKKIDSILELIRKSTAKLFTVKMRIGFDTTDNFADILNLINKHKIDLLSLHGRTVKEMYRSEVHYKKIKQAVETINCPVLANGNITSASKAKWVVENTGSAGVMVGRSAIRNPWIFRQIREKYSGKKMYQPKLIDVRNYIDKLYKATWQERFTEQGHINRLKKFLNFIGQSVDSEGKFLHQMRRAQSKKEFFDICDDHLIANKRSELYFANEPFEKIIARPNHEKPNDDLSYSIVS